MRAFAIVVALFLVNLPLAHEKWTDHRIDAEGRPVVAQVTKTRDVNGRHFVDFRLPLNADPKQRIWSARLDNATFDRVKDTRELEVRYVPGDPAANRPEGEVSSNLLLVIAIVADLVLLLIGAMIFWRGRRWWRVEVRWVEGEILGVRLDRRELACLAPEGWLAHARIGEMVRGELRLVAESDILPAIPDDEETRLDGARYRICGRVADVSAGATFLELSDGFRLRVDVGPFRNRADLRDHAEVTGTLMFTPR